MSKAAKAFNNATIGHHETLFPGDRTLVYLFK